MYVLLFKLFQASMAGMSPSTKLTLPPKLAVQTSLDHSITPEIAGLQSRPIKSLV